MKKTEIYGGLSSKRDPKNVLYKIMGAIKSSQPPSSIATYLAYAEKTCFIVIYKDTERSYFV